MPGSTYVVITRDDFEEWLNSLRSVVILGWARVPGKTGVYLAHFSEDVSMWISSSISDTDRNMGKDQAAMTMRLVSRHYPAVTLNKKDVGQKRFYRTMNWKDNLGKVVRQMRDTYMDGKEFYDKRARIENRETYQREWSSKIKNIPGYENNTFLMDLLKKLEDGQILSDKQENAIIGARQGEGEARPHTRVDQDMVGRLTQLIQDNPSFDLWPKFLSQVQRGYSMSTRQIELIDQAEARAKARASRPPASSSSEPTVDQELVNRIEALMRVSDWQALPDLLAKAKRGWTFTDRMLAALDTAEEVAHKKALARTLSTVNELLELGDLAQNDRAFLTAARAKLRGGRNLGPREFEHLQGLHTSYRQASLRASWVEIPAAL